MEYCLKLSKASKKAALGELTADHARKLASELVELSTGEEVRRVTVAMYFEEWLESKRVTKSEGTFVRYKGVLDEFRAHIGKRRESASIESVTPSEVKRFRDRQIDDGKSASTANTVLKTLRAVFNSARREGVVDRNPAEAIETLKTDREARDVFDHEQLRKLLAAASSDWKTMVLLGYWTGARLSDCANMTWANVSFEKQEIRYFPKKTSGEIKRDPDWKKNLPGQLSVPLMHDLEEHLLVLAASDDPKGKLCPALAGKPTGGNRGLSRLFHGVMDDAGIVSDRGVEKKGKGRQFKTLGFHSLRHTFVSELANKGVTSDIRQTISGHKSEEIHERYTHLDVDTKREAMKKMRSISGGADAVDV